MWLVGSTGRIWAPLSSPGAFRRRKSMTRPVRFLRPRSGLIFFSGLTRGKAVIGAPEHWQAARQAAHARRSCAAGSGASSRRSKQGVPVGHCYRDGRTGVFLTELDDIANARSGDLGSAERMMVIADKR